MKILAPLPPDDPLEPSDPPLVEAVPPLAVLAPVLAVDAAADDDDGTPPLQKGGLERGALRCI